MSTTEEDTQSVALPSTSLLQIANLEKFLSKVCPVLLDADQEDSTAAFIKALKQNETQSTLKKFISDPNTPALLIQRQSREGGF